MSHSVRDAGAVAGHTHTHRRPRGSGSGGKELRTNGSPLGQCSLERADLLPSSEGLG